MFQPKTVEKIKTHFYVQQLFPKIVPFLDDLQKYGRVRQATIIHYGAGALRA
jgi:hypothetical protein